MPPAAASAARRTVFGSLAYRALTWCHRLAESGYGGMAVGGWGVLQASVVPGPTDTVLIPLGIADPRRVFRLASWATAGAVLGGLIAFLIGAHAFDTLGRPLLELLGVSAQTLQASESAFASKGWMLVLLSTVSPLSSKMVCLAAGAFGLPLWIFLPALLAGRALRFFTIAFALRFAGPRVLDVVSRAAGVRPQQHVVLPPVQQLAS